MRWTVIPALLALLVQAGCHDAARKVEPGQETRPSWRVPAGSAQRGSELAKVCLGCHGTAPAITQPLAPRLNRQRASALFFAIIDYRDGRRESAVMKPLLQGVTDQDARDLAAALSGQMLDRPPAARVDHPAYTMAARECLWCHGETGIGEFEGMPVLAGQDAAYLAAAMAAYRDDGRSNPTMRAVAARLNAEQMAMLAAYYAEHEWLERSP